MGHTQISATLITDDLGLGGAEGILARMANYWAKKGWRITFMTLQNGCSPHFWRLDPPICYVDFDWPRVYDEGVPRLRLLCSVVALRRAIRRTGPDFIISFLNTNNVAVLMAMYGSGVPIVVSERSDPHYDRIPRKWEYLRRIFYPTAACVVTQTQAALDYFSPYIRGRGRVISNPVFPPDEFETGRVHVRKRASQANNTDLRPAGVMPDRDVSKQKPADDGPDIRFPGQAPIVNATPPKRIIAVGRLAAEKGFDRLITAFSRLHRMHTDWSLTIWGEGSERTSLEQLVRELRLDGRVRLPGVTRSIHQKLLEADLFVLSSCYEGFPNALCEAMACGLPVISFDCPSGPRAIIRNGVDGILVPPGDIDALADAMYLLMTDESLRARLAGNAVKISERFRMERIMGMWEDVIAQSLKGERGGHDSIDPVVLK